jgi:hypothetical protein
MVDLDHIGDINYKIEKYMEKSGFRHPAFGAASVQRLCARSGSGLTYPFRPFVRIPGTKVGKRFLGKAKKRKEVWNT